MKKLRFDAMDSSRIGSINTILSRFNPRLTVKNPAHYEHVVEVGAPVWQRMEFLGDAVINLAAACDGFDKFPDHQEGKLTKHRTSLVKGTTLTEMCKYCGVASLLESTKDTRNPKVLEDTFECFVGAMYLDHSFDETRTWFCNMAQQYCDAARQTSASTNKDRFLRACKGRRVDAQASFDKLHGLWVCSITLDGVVVAVGLESSKKDALDRGFADALSYIGEIKQPE